MDMTCKYCGGELFEDNGSFLCRSCDKKYIVSGGELVAAVCKDCGGNLLDKGDCYLCELCFRRYEKSSGKEDMNERPWKEKFYPAYELAFSTEKAEDVINSAEILTEKAIAAVGLISEIKSDDAFEEALNEISAKYLGAVYFLRRHSYHSDVEFKIPKEGKKTLDDLMEIMEKINRGMEDIRLSNQRADKLKSLSSAFLVKIYNVTGDTVYLKMLGERAAGIFGSNRKFEDIEENCPEIAQIIHFCKDEMECSQEELTAEYWADHREKFEKLNSEKARLEEENERLWKDQKDLENKAEYMEQHEEKNIGNIMMEYSEKEVDILDKIFEIEDELCINHYPGEEAFVEMLSSEMKKAQES